MAINTIIQPTSSYSNNVNFPSVDNNTTTTYTLTIQDLGQIVEMQNAGACTLTIPPNSAVPFPIGATITIAQYGAGQIAISPGSGVTVRARGAFVHLNAQYSVGYVTQRALNEWYFYGDIVA